MGPEPGEPPRKLDPIHSEGSAMNQQTGRSLATWAPTTFSSGRPTTTTPELTAFATLFAQHAQLGRRTRDVDAGPPGCSTAPRERGLV